MNEAMQEAGSLSASGVCAEGQESSLGLLPASYLQDSLRTEENSSLWPSSTRIVPGLHANPTEQHTENEKRKEDLALQDVDDEASGFEVELDMEELNNLEADFSDFSEDNLLLFSGDRSNCDDGQAGSSGSSINDIGPRAGQGVGCAMESQSPSEVDTEDEIRAVLGQDGRNALTLLPRPGLEGQSSFDCTVPPSAALVERECAEGSVEVSPVPGGDGGGGGDGSSGHTSDSGIVPPTRPSTLLTAEKLGRPSSSNTTFTRMGPLGNEDSAVENWPAQLGFTRDRTSFGSAAKDESVDIRASGLRSHLLQPGLEQMDDSYGIRPWDADESSLRPENFVPRALVTRDGDGSEAGRSVPTPSQSPQVNFSDDQISARSSSLGMVPSLSDKGGHVSSSTDIQMYQNILDEDFGRCNPFDEAEVVGFDRMDLNDEEFVGADKALEMINDDEKLFEEEHKFRQDDPMRSISLGSSWAQPPTRDITRPSWMTEVDDADSRVSFGQFLRSRTAALGSLDSKERAERPHFGNKVITPPRSAPPLPLIEVDGQMREISEIKSSTGVTAAAAEPAQANTTKDYLPMADSSTANETGVLSLSTISQLIAEASVSNDAQAMVEMVIKWSKQLNSSKQKPSEAAKHSKVSKSSSKTRSLPLTSGSTTLPRDENVKPAAEAHKVSEQHSGVGMPRNLASEPLDWRVIRPSSVIGYGSHTESNRPPRVQFETPATWKAGEAAFVTKGPSKVGYQTSTPFQAYHPLLFDFSPSLVTLPSPPDSPSSDVTPKQPRESLEIGEASNFVWREGTNRSSSTLVATPEPSHFAATMSSFPVMNEASRQGSTSQLSSNVQASPNSIIAENRNAAHTVHNIVGHPNATTSAEFRPLEVDTSATSDYKSSQHSMVVLDRLARTELYSSTSVTRPQSSTSSSRMGGTVSLQRAMALKLPESLQFAEVVAVGVPTEAILCLQNPTTKWLQCSLKVDSLTVNGQPFPEQMSPFAHKNTLVVEPSCKDEIKITFSSRVPGQVVARLHVAAQVMASCQQGCPEFPTASVMLYAEAELPNIQVLLGKQKMLDFGVLPEDSCTEMSLGLVNVGQATVPLRLVIHENAPAWQGFYFPKKNVECGSPPPRQFESSRILTCLLPGQATSSVPLKVVNFLVAFRAHGLEGLSEALVSVSSTLTLELDTKASVGNILRTVPLQACIGRAQLETVTSIIPVRLRACPNTLVEKTVPLRNSGAIPLVLEMSIRHQPHLFSISPHATQLVPGQATEVRVRFSPHELIPSLKSALLITICPGGLIYELQIIAETFPATPVPEDFALESDKQLLAWPGLSLGEMSGKEVVLKNCSQVGTVELQLQVHNDGEEFKLQVGPNLTHATTLTIPSCGVHPVTVIYKAQSLDHSTSKLTIKPLQVVPSLRPLRYVLPLLGYGGTSKLQLVEARQIDGDYHADVGAVSCGTTTLHHLFLRNVGERAAFAKVLVGSSVSSPLVPYAAEVIVSCNEFIVERSKTAEVVVAIRSSTWNDSSPPPPKVCFGALSIFYGDEVNRRRCRRSLRDGVLSSNMPSGHPLNGVNFNVAYAGEQLQEQEEDLPQTQHDQHVFFSGISSFCVWLSTERLQLPAKLKVKPSHLPSSRLVNPSSPPVREFQPGWDVTPKELKLNLVEDSGSAPTKTFSVVNSTGKSISFQIMWPAHLLSLSPAEATVPARKSVCVTVQPVLSDSVRTDSPRDASVVVKCNNQQQEVHVTIVKTAKIEGSPTLALSPVKVASKEIVFSNTALGQSSEFRMEMSNTSPVIQLWALTPTNVGQFKKVKSEASAPSLTYSVFRFAKMSGRLTPKQTTEVPVTFLPLDYGDFSQSWDMTSRGASGKDHKIRLELRGSCYPQVKAQSSKTSGRKIRQKVGPNQDRPVFSPSYSIDFPVTKCGRTACVKLALNNISTLPQDVAISSPNHPFYINHDKLTLRERHYIRVPMHFKPDLPGTHCDTLTIDTNLGYKLEFQVQGKAESDGL